MLIIRAVALFILCLGVLPAAAETRAADPPDTADWGARLERDARAFHAAIAARHPGLVDDENPGFPGQMDAALERTLQRVSETSDYGGYWWALREFRATFNDGHVQVMQQPGSPALPSRWPG